MVKKKTVFRPEHMITTVPVIRTCRHCGVWLAAGIVEGVHREVELHQIDDTQVIMCVLSKVPVFGLMRTGLVELDAGRLQDPRFQNRYPGHSCGVVWERRISGVGKWTTPADTTIPPY